VALYQVLVLVVAVRPLHFEMTDTKIIEVSEDQSDRLFLKKSDVDL